MLWESNLQLPKKVSGGNGMNLTKLHGANDY